MVGKSTFLISSNSLLNFKYFGNVELFRILPFWEIYVIAYLNVFLDFIYLFVCLFWLLRKP